MSSAAIFLIPGMGADGSAGSDIQYEDFSFILYEDMTFIQYEG